jgi:hypothetical protein
MWVVSGEQLAKVDNFASQSSEWGPKEDTIKSFWVLNVVAQRKLVELSLCSSGVDQSFALVDRGATARALEYSRYDAPGTRKRMPADAILGFG